MMDVTMYHTSNGWTDTPRWYVHIGTAQIESQQLEFKLQNNILLVI